MILFKASGFILLHQSVAKIGEINEVADNRSVGRKLGALAACVHSERPMLFGGAAIYDAQCSACHGPQGQGDGPFADKLLYLPTDLSSLQNSNGGTFPDMHLRGILDGSGRADHFSGAMPTFGTGASSADEVALTPAQIDALIAYLEGLQR